MNIFKFDAVSERQFKLKPTIEINQQINVIGTNLHLCAIVFHSGASVKAGHYTSAVLVEGNWFLTNYENITSWVPKYYYDRNCDNFPYFVMYKKSEEQNSSLEKICEPNTTPFSYADAVKRTKQKNGPEDMIHEENEIQTPEEDIDFNVNKMFVNLSNVLENSDVSDSPQFTKQSVVKELFWQTKKMLLSKKTKLLI